MRWPWRRKPVIDCEGWHALEQAKRERIRVEARESHVDWLAEQMRKAGESNHFSELILEAMIKKRRRS